MGWAEKLLKAKKGDVIQMVPMFPGITDENMEMRILKRHGDKITAEMMYFGVIVSRFVYRLSNNSFKEA